MKFKRFIGLVFFIGIAWFIPRVPKVEAATITSFKTGNWNATSTWTGGVVPGSGDVVTIGGAHTITVSSPVTIGNGSTSYAITLGNANAVLNVQADLTVRSAGIRINSGKFRVDAIAAGAPVTLTLAAEGSTNSAIFESGNTLGRVIEFIGDAMRPVTVTATRTGTGVGQFLSSASVPGQTAGWKFRHVNLIGLGGTGSLAMFSNVPEVDMQDVLMKNSGRVNIVGNGDFTFKMDRVDFRNFLDVPIIYRNSADKGVKDRALTNSTFSSSVGATTGYLQAPDLVVNNVVSYNTALFSYQNANDAKRQRWSNVTFISNGGWSDELLTVPPGGDNRFDNIVLSRFYPTSQNVHTIKDIQGPPLNIGPNQLTNSFIDAWGNGNSAVGDTVLNNGDWIIDYNIAIGKYGNLFDGFHGNSGTVKARHNTLGSANLDTVSSHNQGAMVLAEAFSSPNKISEIKGNLFFDTLQGVAMGYNSSFPSYQWAPQNSMVLDYNGAYNMLDPQNFFVPGTTIKSYLFQPGGTKIQSFRTLGSSIATSGTNQTTLVISNALFITNGVKAGDVVYKGSGLTSKAALVQSVDSESQLTLGASINVALTNGIVGLAPNDSVSIHAGYWADGGKYGDDGKGMHDVYANPSFFDGTRNTSSWSVSLGGDGTALSVISEMLKINGYDINANPALFNPNYSNTNLLNYIRAGYAPTNTAFKGTSYEGGDIGAVPVVGSVPPPPVEDLTAPLRSGGSPSGVLAVGTTSVTASFSTDEVATCRYAVSPDVDYALMSAPFGAVASTVHSETYSGLAPGVYNYYIRCIDAVGNANQDDYVINFSILSDTTSPNVALVSPADSSVVSGIVIVTASASDDVGIVGVQFRVDGVDYQSEDLVAPYEVSWDTNAVMNGSFTLTAVARDQAGNNTISLPIHVSVLNIEATGDLVPPLRMSGSPHGVLSAGTNSTILSLTTDEAATCKYETTANTSYGAMLNTFTNTGGTSHYTNVSGLTPGASYMYYVRCQDQSGNTNIDDYVLSFSLGSASPVGLSRWSPGIFEVKVLSVTTSSVTMSWKTDVASTGIISYGSTSPYAYTLNKNYSTAVTDHTLVITNLQPGTTYHYQIKAIHSSGGTSSNQDSSFTTL